MSFNRTSMPAFHLLKIRGDLPVLSQNAGLFISRGEGIHPKRVINSYELIFVRQGRLGMFEGRRQFELGAGQTLLLWPEREHGGTIPYPPDLSFYWIHFTLSPGAGKSPTLLLSLPQLVTLRRPERLTELFRRFLDDQESGFLTLASGACLIIQMLTEVSRSFKNSRLFESPSCAVLASRAKDYIRTHYGQPVSARDIARALQCNPDYLGRVFRLAFGCTLTERLHQSRILKAKSLLMDSTLNINEITRECGFNDGVYFRRIFERQCDMPPLAFRKLYTRLHINTV